MREKCMHTFYMNRKQLIRPNVRDVIWWLRIVAFGATLTVEVVSMEAQYLRSQKRRCLGCFVACGHMVYNPSL